MRERAMCQVAQELNLTTASFNDDPFAGGN